MISGDDVKTLEPGFWKDLFGKTVYSFFWGNVHDDKTDEIYDEAFPSQQKIIRFGSILSIGD